MAFADFQQLVTDLVPDQAANVTPDVQRRAIEEAAVRYGADVPRVLTEEVVWPQQGVFGPVPASWTDQAVVRSAEYPVGQHPASILFVDAYRDLIGTWGMESVRTLPEGAVVRVQFNLPHVLDDDSDTIPVLHRWPVAQYAAHLLCQQLATRFSAERESAIGADVSRTESRASMYARRAKEYRAGYYAGIGVVDPLSQAELGSALTPAAAVTSWPGRTRLFRRGAPFL
ncbi:hypothetical protein ABE501_05405 [Comamonas testosteroni]